MKIVIEVNDIPKNDHERWALSHGTPLPKGCRLIDANAVTKDLNTFQDAFVINIDKTSGRFMGIACTAPTIIEAEGSTE